MTYEILLLDPALAATREAAAAAHKASSCWHTSELDHARGARKWPISDALLKFNPDMERMEPTDPAQGSGWFGKIKGEQPEERRYLAMSLLHGDYITNFTVFDQAVEVEFAEGIEVSEAGDIAREVWRHLQALAQQGLTTVYDSERDVLLDLNADFETVLQGYIANLKLDAEFDAADDAAERAMADATRAPDAPPVAAAGKPPPAHESFTGNVEAKKKPWWKF